MAERGDSVARETNAAYSYARDAGHLDFVKKAETCDNYFAGMQWDPQVRRRLERLGKPIITINKTLATLAAIFGEQLDNRADVSFRPSKDGVEETATALDKVWLHVANSNELDFLESEVAADGFIRGRGFYDVRLAFDDALMGEVRIKQLNSKNVVIDPDAESYDPKDWKEVFVTKWLTKGDIELFYSPAAAKELAGRTPQSFSYQYDSLDWLPDRFGTKFSPNSYDANQEMRHRRVFRVIERQFKDIRYLEHLVDLETGDMRPVPEAWDRERIALVTKQYGLGVLKKKVERIRWAVVCDDLTLHHEWSPMEFFTPVPYFPYFRHGTTIGIVENIIPVQDLLNKSVSQELHIINTTANSGYKVKTGALSNMTIRDLEERGGEDGIVIELNDINGLDKLDPNQIPSGIDRVSFKADEALKEVSMVSDSMRGFDRADVAAKAIKAKQARGTVSLAKPFENLAQTRKILARNVLSLIQNFYTETRVLNITGRNLTDQTEQMVVNQPTPEGNVANDLTIGEYDVVVTTVPARETFEQSQFQEALEMRQLGIAIPDDVLIEHSHLNRKAEIAKRIKEAQGGGDGNEAAQQMAQMEMQLKQMEIAEKEAAIQKTQAQAALEAARAKKEIVAIERGDDPNQIEREKMAIEQERAAAQILLDREKAHNDIQLQREKMQADLAMKREEHTMNMELSKQQAAHEENRRYAETEAQIEASGKLADAKAKQAAKAPAPQKSKEKE